MTTTYYTFRTRKVKVSGGTDLMTLVPVAQSNTVSDQAPAKAEIIDFNFCRRHEETRQAWKALTDAARSNRPAEDAPAAKAARPAAEPKKLSLTERVELLSSAAVVVTALSAAAVLLSSL